MSSMVYILSDSTGETASSMVKAAVVHFRNKDIQIVKSRNVRTVDQIESVIEEVKENSGLLVHTLASESMRKAVQESAEKKNIIHVDLLGPLLEALSIHLGDTEASGQVGLLRKVDESYFKRIEAIEFTVKHDDGKSLVGLRDADIVLVGISRTSKTPLSIFLSHKGWKVANVPLVFGQALPAELFDVDQRRVVGLIIDAESLQRIRRKRLEKFGQDPGGEYASMAHIAREIEYATDIYKKNKRWPVFNVTDRALEETASEIVRFVSARLGLPSSL
jgi:[pyruvate, water dikinase]-phosphate phosphotransferase / [pyruvate, water dikinase] kinase